MNNHTPHTDPAGAFYEAIADVVVRKLMEEIGRASLGGEPTDGLAIEKLGGRGLDLMRAYSAKEVAELLGTSRVESVYEIPENELPRVRRIGKSFGYLGINVLCYMAGRPPVDIDAAIEEYRKRLTEGRGNVLPMGLTEGLTRVL
ncbi:MAG: hypothetical protein R2834_02955 [Rhodothermales bacterium]